MCLYKTPCAPFRLVFFLVLYKKACCSFFISVPSHYESSVLEAIEGLSKNFDNLKEDSEFLKHDND